ncbi:MAG TPA: hypothetical protein VFZ53_13325 [Polyangiaceae bacterium]
MIERELDDGEAGAPGSPADDGLFFASVMPKPSSKRPKMRTTPRKLLQVFAP